MRKIFSETIEQFALKDESILFLTGDLGFNAFENLQQSLGDRFINMGVAEQNMIGVAAGMAHEGFKVFCYSIAPFIVYRCLEQFRNDVCFHNLPVFLVGNGGGYGYGIMGASHHALEDIACLGALPNANCYIPAFNEDVLRMVNEIISDAKPAYLRLGLGKKSPCEKNIFGSFSQIKKAENPLATVVVLGPLVNNILEAIGFTGAGNNFDLFTLQNLPLQMHREVLDSIKTSGNVLIVEEHISPGGMGERIAHYLLEKNIKLNKFISLSAKGYPDGKYGSQGFHQRQSGLDSHSIAKVLKSF